MGFIFFLSESELFYFSQSFYSRALLSVRIRFRANFKNIYNNSEYNMINFINNFMI